MAVRISFRDQSVMFSDGGAIAMRRAAHPGRVGNWTINGLGNIEDTMDQPSSRLHKAGGIGWDTEFPDGEVEGQCRKGQIRWGATQKGGLQWVKNHNNT